jgi:transcriptional regulator with XRE-family HTH domain
MTSKFELSPHPLDPKTVKKRLIDLGMTQRRLTALSGLTTATVVRYINGSGRNLYVQRAIATVLGVSLESLWESGAEEEPRPAA